MIKFSQIIQEEFLTGGKIGGDYYEIYINPTSDEIAELGDNYRVVIDTKDKKVYVTDSELLHQDMVKVIKTEGELQDFNYTMYWKFGKGVDRFITMDIGETGYYVDSLSDIILKTRDSDKGDEIKSQIDLTINSDFGWIRGKWFNHKKFQTALDEVREMV